MITVKISAHINDDVIFLRCRNWDFWICCLDSTRGFRMRKNEKTKLSLQFFLYYPFSASGSKYPVLYHLVKGISYLQTIALTKSKVLRGITTA